MRRHVTAVVLTVLFVLFGSSAAWAATWSSSDKWAEWVTGEYTLRNNIWGSGVGTQTIWANSHRDWGVTADHPNTGGVKSYPHAAVNINRPISEVGELSSTYAVNVPQAGAYATAYDIWLDDHAYEIMLWMNQYGPVGPIGEFRETVTVGGHTWDVYTGSNGSNEVFSFVRTGNSNAGTVDVAAVLRWIQEQGWYGDVTVGDVQFGYEITSSAGGLDFNTTDYSVTQS